MSLSNGVAPSPARPPHIEEIRILGKQVGERVHVVTVPGANDLLHDCSYDGFVLHTGTL